MSAEATTDLPLFAWQPAACQFIAFPLSRQVGKVRDVAGKLLGKTTDRHVAYYREQVTEALIARMTKAGITDDVQDKQLRAFWQAVELEMARHSHRAVRA